MGREICGITYLAELDSLESRETIFYEIKETLEIKKEEIFLIKEPLVTGNHPLFESYDPVRHKPQRIGNAKDWQRIYDEQISIVRKHEWEIFRIYGMGPVIRALIVAALFWLFIRTSGKTNWGKFLLSIIIFLMIVVCCLHFEASPKNFLRPENYILRNMILFPTLTLVAMVLIRKVGKRVSKKKE